MRNRLSVRLFVALFISIAFAAFAADEVASDKKKAVDLIQKAIEHIKKVGKDQAFKDFTNKDGGFVDGSFYIFAVDFKGLTLAHGGNPALVGQSMFELKDADGKFFIQDFIKVAKEKGSAWVDYKWSNPTTKKVEPKSTYVKRVEGTEYFLGCGIYLKK
jgi:cytochrome c